MPDHQEAAVYSTAVNLRGRRIIIRYCESPHPNVPPEDIHIDILNCEREDCGYAFAVESDVSTAEKPNRKRFHHSGCQKADWRYSEKLAMAGVHRGD